MRVLRSFDWADCYRETIRQVLEEPDCQVGPRGLQTNEVLDLRFTLPGSDSGVVRDVTDQRYLAGELVWYFTGRNDLAFIRRYSSFWERIAREDGTCASAYGELLFRTNGHELPEWQWAYQCLAGDLDSRQAVMTLLRPYHHETGAKDVVCTTQLAFLVRDGQLDLRGFMRSSDVYYGLQFDVPFFLLLLRQMHQLLLPVHPDLRLGDYHHTAISTHAYASKFPQLKRLLEQPFRNEPLPEINEWLVGADGRSNPALDTIARIAMDPSMSRGRYLHPDPLVDWIADRALRPKEVQHVPA